MDKKDDNITDFGYQSLSNQDKQEKVAQVFNSVSKKYDLMNDLMSLYLHRLWKKKAINMAHVKHGDHVLDIASGTCDLGIIVAKKIGESGKLFLTDVNEQMLKIGKNKMIDAGIINNVEYTLANAENLPFVDNIFDKVFISFGLRNVTNKLNATKEMFRVLKKGGLLTILEFSRPENSYLNALYDLYSFFILPKIGKFIAKDELSYKYLAESIRAFPTQEELKNMLLISGFYKCVYTNFSNGIVALHRAWKV